MSGGSSETFDVTLDFDSCIEVLVVNGSGSNYSGEMGYSIADSDGNELLGFVGSESWGAPVMTGGVFGNCVTDCGDANADNYNADADIIDNTLCSYSLVQGCMAEDACNYDASAQQDDGSCEYAEAGYDCAGNFLCDDVAVVLALTSNSTYNDGWYGMSYTITDADGNIAAQGTPVGNFATLDVDLCLAAGCYSLYQDYTWVGYGWTLGDASGTSASGGVTTNDISIGGAECGPAPVLGCMDMTACNYDETATEDDGTCYNNDLGCGCDQPAAVDGFD